MALAGRDVWQQNLPTVAHVGAGGTRRGLCGTLPSAVTPWDPHWQPQGCSFAPRLPQFGWFSPQNTPWH